MVAILLFLETQRRSDGGPRSMSKDIAKYRAKSHATVSEYELFENGRGRWWHSTLEWCGPPRRALPIRSA